MAVDVSTAPQQPAPARSPLPLFYREVRPVEPTRHADKSLPEPISFRFAAGTNSVPVNGHEFVVAQRHYPIVFARNGESLIALALLGLKRDENLYVDGNGRWLPNAYIPGYVRRFPFVFIEAPDKRYALAVEQSFLVDNGRRRLFDAGRKPTALLQGALAFCGTYQKNFGETREFFEALTRADLLVDQQADAAAPQGQKIRLAGFQVVDPDRWRNMPLGTFAEWRAKGWADWVYAHIFSQGNWRSLAQRAGMSPNPQG